MYPVRVEYKYDEIRCHVIVRGDTVEFLSYAGKPLANMQRFAGLFRGVCRTTGYWEFDCGFEANGNFNDSYRWVRSTKALPADLVNAPVKFYLFDLPGLDSETYRERVTEFQWIIDLVFAWGGTPLYLPHGTTAYTEGEVEDFFLKARAAGKEGVMVKSFEHLYQRGKRIDGWWKMKPEDTADGRITGINQAFAEDGTAHERAGSITVELEDGSVASPAGLEHALAADMFYHPEKYIGQWVEFKFMERDRQGGYRHPSFVRFREDKQ